jgi:hypothetical protein
MIFSNYIGVWPGLSVPAPNLTTEENMLLMNLKMRATVKLSQAGPGMFIPIDESIKLQFAQLNQTL